MRLVNHPVDLIDLVMDWFFSLLNDVLRFPLIINLIQNNLIANANNCSFSVNLLTGNTICVNVDELAVWNTNISSWS